MDMDKERKESYIEELKRCAKADCDFYLEHNEVIEFYNYIHGLQKEIILLKQDNEFYQRHMGITRAVLNKSGFMCQTVSEEEIEKCDAQFIVEYNDEGMIQLYRKMTLGTLGEFDE